MKNSALKQFTTDLSKIWGPLSSDLTKQSKQLLEQLSQNCMEEDWVQTLLDKKPAAEPVYISEEHGFILMAHVEPKGEYSPPHDHGNGWVLYSTVKGAVDMGIYHKIVRTDGKLELVQKDAYTLGEGQCSVYLPGDIHDTRSQEDNTLMLRLTSCDFSRELEEGRLVRYKNYQTW